MNKVLIITYYWPPSGGAGVQRWLRFSKYLPQFEWEPFILTVDPAYAAYPVTDDSLLSGLPSSVKIYKTPATDYFSIYKKNKSKIPSAGFANSAESTLLGTLMRFVRGNFFIPDPRRGWNKYAFKKACDIIESEGISHVITTSPPHSTQLIGLKLRKKYPEIKWIADLRDPWTDIYYYSQFYHTFIAREIDKGYEKKVLREADCIITVGKSLKSHYSKKIPGIDNKLEVITNGYDEDDFEGNVSGETTKFTISYIGTLSDSYPIESFLDALNTQDVKDRNYILKFVGTVSPKQKELILSKIEKSSVEFIPYVDHNMAISYMHNSDLLLLIIPDHQSNKSIITGKLFEYIASGKPIICLGPVDGDAGDIITSNKCGSIFGYNDLKGISDYIKESFLNRESGINNITPNDLIQNFSGKTLTAKLVQVIRQIK
jgi:glycosyltransferase involved in cell wall biosynthesis